MIKRRKTRLVRIGNIGIGYKFPVSIQAMAKAKTQDIKSIVREMHDLEKNGAEAIRLAVKDKRDVDSLKHIKELVKVPLIADIHFDWRLAVAAINNGVDKIRINPGNIYKKDEIKQIVLEAKKAHIPIRVGVNSGSISKKVSNIQSPVIKMVRSALDYLRLIEKMGFYDIVVSLKASDVIQTIAAYRKFASICDYPLHLGITAAGASGQAQIKSAIGIGALLSEGIGDTIRVSLTGPSVNEVITAKQILNALNLRRFDRLEVISCPTCGRCEVDLAKVVGDLEQKLLAIDYQPSAMPLKVAIMGCIVNGPGEAREADLGLAFGRKSAILFKKGKIIKKVDAITAAENLFQEIKRII
ncbi:MAG: flavodoxin-dependent (E)-4-hydroxy-3-methylbut-2-enyl-diphosphate synthase [Candidatus Omnitrophota bacterium]